MVKVVPSDIKLLRERINKNRAKISQIHIRLDEKDRQIEALFQICGDLLYAINKNAEVSVKRFNEVQSKFESKLWKLKKQR